MDTDGGSQRRGGRRNILPQVDPPARERSPRRPEAQAAAAGLDLFALPQESALDGEHLEEPDGMNVEQRREYSDLRDFIERNLSSPSGEVKNMIRKTSMPLLATADSIQKISDRLSEFQDQLQMLERDEFPSGVRPFSIAFESPHLDTQMTDGGFTFTVDLAGLSLRDAKKKAFAAHLAVQKRLDLIMMRAQLGDLRGRITRENFINQCLAIERCRSSPFEFLGLTADPELELNPDRLKNQLSAIYMKVINQAVARKQARLDQLAKEDARRKNIAKSVAARSPEDLLTMVIDSRISHVKGRDKKRNGKGIGSAQFPVAPEWYHKAKQHDDDNDNPPLQS